MRYFYDTTITNKRPKYGVTYKCNHKVYTYCTLYLNNGFGLAVIQQRFDWKTKRTWWTEIDPELVDDLYLQMKFQEYFSKHANLARDGLYPTVTIRQIMWGLKMKPLKRQAWETVFDKCDF